jgi:hypothetical protein
LRIVLGVRGVQFDADQTKLIQWYVQNLPDWYREQLPSKWTGPFNEHWRQPMMAGNDYWEEDEDEEDEDTDPGDAPPAGPAWTKAVREIAVGHAVHIGRILVTEACSHGYSPEDAMDMPEAQLMIQMLLDAAQIGDDTLIETLCTEVGDVRTFVNSMAGPPWDSPLPALSVAAKAGNVGVVELLLSKGADPFWAENCCIAYEREGHDGTITELLAGYVDVNACPVCQGDKRGSTARQLAARAGHYDVVRVLEARKRPKSWVDSTLRD